MKFYVMGYDGGNMVLMTRKSFDSFDQADAYAKSCGSAWRAFVVQDAKAAGEST